MPRIANIGGRRVHGQPDLGYLPVGLASGVISDLAKRPELQARQDELALLAEINARRWRNSMNWRNSMARSPRVLRGRR
jgi:hypothetical protein